MGVLQQIALDRLLGLLEAEPLVFAQQLDRLDLAPTLERPDDLVWHFLGELIHGRLALS
ncbi:hypothetical protein D3C80_1997560 [compost metagenome]